MKTKSIFALVLFVGVVALSACKSGKTGCDAYGKNAHSQNTKHISVAK